MSIYVKNSAPTRGKIEEFDNDYFTFYRFQCKDWEMGAKSWGMIFDTEEEAIEKSEEYGIDLEYAVLDGKSACGTAEELFNFINYFNEDFVVLILNGQSVGTGHDNEDVIDVDHVEEIWSYEDYLKYMQDLGY